ncbi:MAG: hypothetical protein ACFFAO_10560 [Candidatus Hermodarchaeota archaeon]
MKIKVIEKELSIKKVFEVLKTSFNSQFRLIEKSQIVENHLSIVAILPKKFTVVILGQNNSKEKRFLMSVEAINLTILKSRIESINNLKHIENYFNKLLINLESEKNFNPFESIFDNHIKNFKFKRSLAKIEKTILNRISQKLNNELEYRDDLMKYPFSVINNNGTWESWEKVYDVYKPYLRKLEKNIRSNYSNVKKIYTYYDFSLLQELYQRIFDLIVIERKKIKSKKDIEDDKEIDVINQTITFVYTHKKSFSMKLLDIMKLSREIRDYISRLENKLKPKKAEIKARLILVSLFGFEDKVAKYLCDNINQEKKYIIPIFIAPPIDRRIWHNFKEDFSLSNEEKNEKKKVEHYIKMHKQNPQKHNYNKYMLKDAKAQYNELVKREEKTEKTGSLLERWYNILNLESIDELLDVQKIGSMEENIELL